VKIRSQCPFEGDEHRYRGGRPPPSIPVFPFSVWLPANILPETAPQSTSPLHLVLSKDRDGTPQSTRLKCRHILSLSLFFLIIQYLEVETPFPNGSSLQFHLLFPSFIIGWKRPPALIKWRACESLFFPSPPATSNFPPLYLDLGGKMSSSIDYASLCRGNSWFVVFGDLVNPNYPTDVLLLLFLWLPRKAYNCIHGHTWARDTICFSQGVMVFSPLRFALSYF